jgi:hypothetical protein
VGMGCAAGAGLEGKPPLATVSVTVTASFPSLLVTDIFCQGLPKQVRSFTHVVCQQCPAQAPKQHATSSKCTSGLSAS